jgi:hypothetical protein
VLYTTTDPKVVRNYVIALLLGDIGHLAVTFYVLEYERFVDVSKWNAMAWGNIATTVRVQYHGHPPNKASLIILGISYSCFSLGRRT